MKDLLIFEERLKAHLSATLGDEVASSTFRDMWVHDLTNGWLRVSFPTDETARRAREMRVQLRAAATAVVSVGVVSRADIFVRPEGAGRGGYRK